MTSKNGHEQKLPILIDHLYKHLVSFDCRNLNDVTQTHISWIILTGKYAYKIKKNLNLGFLDFSTLQKRHHFCSEECRLNRRFAPNLYIDVVKITGTTDRPEINGSGPIVEYAVKMLQFPASSRLDYVISSGNIDANHFELLAYEIATFHTAAQPIDKHSYFGNPSHVIEPQQDNLRIIYNFLQHKPNAIIESGILRIVNSWCTNQFDALTPSFINRKQRGFIRDCHGDLHLENIIYFNNQMIPFDCIEFNDNLRCIDIISDIAFLIMDLEFHGQTGFANRFLNRYLELTDDYTGLYLLNFYKTYRSLVRAKIATIRLNTENLAAPEQQNLNQNLLKYLRLAQSYTVKNKNRMVIMHGLSGSGKSHISLRIVEKMGGIRLRSDFVRKNRFSDNSFSSDGKTPVKELYSKSTTDKVYARLLLNAKSVLESGYDVIIDATFLSKNQRLPFIKLADAIGVQKQIVNCSAPVDALKNRIQSRLKENKDLSDATSSVLEKQIHLLEPLDETELKFTINVDTDKFILEEFIHQLNTNPMVE